MKQVAKNAKNRQATKSQSKLIANVQERDVEKEQRDFVIVRQFLQAGKLDEAMDILRRIQRENAENIQALYLLGCLFFLKQNFNEALNCFETALSKNPQDAILYNNRAVTLEKFGRNKEAIVDYKIAIEIKPDYVEAQCNLGSLLERQGNYEEAVTYLKVAIDYEPGNAKAYNFLGLAYEKLTRWDEAIQAYRKAWQLIPEMIEAANNLGNLLLDRGHNSEGKGVLEQALQEKPMNCVLLNNLGHAYLLQGRADKALEFYQKAKTVNDDGITAIDSNILLSMNYLPFSPQVIFNEHQQWGQKFPSTVVASEFANERTTERRLKIGYVSPDLYSHSVMYFFENVLVNHNRQEFEIFLYSAHPYYFDETTARLHNRADGWRDIAKLTNDEAKELIVQDEIDILVDLAGHCSKNRLTLFAMKPAPVQVTWIGYPNTTGLSQIDYRFTDAIADPPGETEVLHTEELIRLPKTFLCYTPREDIADPAQLPALRKDFVTFASFNNLAKITQPLIALWSSILQGVPNSRLLIKARGLGDESVRQNLLLMFEACQIGEERIIFAERCANIQENFDYYNEVDIALDTFPYHGTTTTCDALWMGVPVVCLAGKSHVSRVGVSLLHNVGLSDLIASNPAEYINIAVDLAKDLSRLAEVRQSLRGKMSASALLDGQAMARNVEIEYRKMWKEWLKTSVLTNGQRSMQAVQRKEVTKELESTSFNMMAYYQMATSLKEKQQWQEAISAYQQVVRLAPDHPEAHASLGAILHHVGQTVEAVKHYEKAIALNPENHALLNNFAILLRTQDKKDQAIQLLEKAVTIQTDYLSAYLQLLQLSHEKGNWEQVIRWANLILTIDKDNLEALKSLGSVYKGRGQRQLAEEFLQRALVIMPKAVDLLNTLGNLFTEAGDIAKAIATYEKALAIQPDEAITYCNLASCLAKQGKSYETLECFRKALELQPKMAKLHSNILLALAYLDDVDPAQIYQEHLQWASSHGESLYPTMIERVEETRKKTQRLKIGYVSPDFRNHSVAFFIEGILQEYDRERFEIVLYSDVKFPDGTTTRTAAMVDTWHDISRLTDEQTYQLIREDRIDILVDLAGHTADNRMPVFARKPAPVQITWIGYPNTTGISTMDYRFTDQYADPVGMTEAFHSEKLIRLKDSFLCYLPRPDSPAVGELPYINNGYITFGSFNNFNKVSMQVVSLWGQILKRVPDSRLLIKSSGFADSYVREKTLKIFNDMDIASERIIMLGQIPAYLEHLATYDSIDIALDTYPYHGTTTTCEALWMGVPVVTLAGNTHVSRVGVSLLSNVGLAECIAVNADEYVAIAVNLATCTRRLKELRGNLREQMVASPLMQAREFTVNLERVYRKLWSNYLDSIDENLLEPVQVNINKKIERLVEQANRRLANGEFDEAKRLYQDIIEINPQQPIALHGLGLIMGQSGDVEQGISLLKQAVSNKQDYFEALYNLGLFYQKKQDMQQMIEILQQAYELKPQHLGVNVNLARVNKELEQAVEAAKFYRQALQIAPDSIEIIFELSHFLSMCGQGSQAIEVINTGLEMQPENTLMLQMLGFAHKMSGNATKALEYYRRAVQIDPMFVDCHSNILSTFNYLPNQSPESIFQEHCAWGEQHANHLRKYFSYHTEMKKSKRLKIGYVSADFRMHSVAYFLHTVLKNYNPTDFEIVLYNNGQTLDEVSNNFKNLTDQWVDIKDLSDAAAAQRIHEDGIDILIDLSGHTGGHRLKVFAYKPAPIQVTWLGYPNTTGIKAMDYRITDQYADPVGMTEAFYTEKLVRLPNGFLSYSPRMPHPEKSILPYRNNGGQVTFGSFNNLAKVTPRLLAMWSEIIKAVPNSRLILKAIGLADQSVQAQLKQFFVARGIDGERIILSGHKLSPAQHMEMYQEVDIALDYFPYNGTTTTCEALWMGVPVVTLAGNNHVSRVGTSLLHYAGCPELVAKDEGEYIRIAVTLATDFAVLQQLREKLIRQMPSSLLLDGIRFTQDLEQQYRNMWAIFVNNS